MRMTEPLLTDADLLHAYSSETTHTKGLRAVAEAGIQAFAAEEYISLSRGAAAIAGAIDRLTAVATAQGS